jgi:hypothetical protein
MIAKLLPPLLASGLLACAALAQPEERNLVHAVTDLSHEFSFYADSHFGPDYLNLDGGDVVVRSWGTLSKYDLTNANLLILMSGASPCPYTEADIAHVREFLEEGGGVAIIGDYALFGAETEYGLNALTSAFGARFSEEAAEKPLVIPIRSNREDVPFTGGSYLTLDEGQGWAPMIVDAKERPVLAMRVVGKGYLLVASRGLAGHAPGGSDPVNQGFWRWALNRITLGKTVTPGQTPPDDWCGVDNLFDKEGLTLGCADYLLPYADAIYAEYAQVRVALEKVLGVPPSEGMLSKMVLLATGGGGFSSGSVIGIAAWWGNFPAERYGMVELLGHESTHSWVLPFPEPLWNEGIATYAGILAGRELGLSKAADPVLSDWIAGARKLDPEMTKYDLAHGTDVPHVVEMAKPMWIWEQLRAERPDALSRYFQEKRRLIDPATRSEFTADDSVALVSIVMERDMFPWFQSLGITVDRSKTTLPVPE